MKSSNVIPFNEDQLRWHLLNNVANTLTSKAIDGIVGTCNKVNKGELQLTDEPVKGCGFTIADMIEDLKLY